jgi:hypothetical protein
MMRRLHIAHMLSYTTRAYRIVEKVQTIDGPRDRFTMSAFDTLEEAEAYIAWGKEKEPTK